MIDARKREIELILPGLMGLLPFSYESEIIADENGYILKIIRHAANEPFSRYVVVFCQLFATIDDLAKQLTDIREKGLPQ
jgi:hypothetical protein